MDKQFDVEAFKRFVASKPADEPYDPYMNTKCALAQFGIRIKGWHEEAVRKGVPRDVFSSAMERPHTFGALSERLSRLSTGEG